MTSLLLTLLTALTMRADSTYYVVLNHGRPAGEMTVVRTGDSVVVRYRFVDRNRGVKATSHYVYAGGIEQQGDARMTALDDTPFGPAVRFETIGDSLRWTGRDTVRKTAARGTYYRIQGTPYDDAATARFLLHRPDHSATVVPDGKLTATVVGDTTVRVGGARQHVRLVAIKGKGYTPDLVWLDDRDELYASSVAWFITVRPGAEQTLDALRAVELRYRNGQGLQMARELAPPPATAIAFTHGDLFDSERGVIVPDQTVVVRGERIVAVGRADSVTVPAGATVIDAKGKTLVPGMWDMHNHYDVTSQTWGGPMQLAVGITSIRDLASDIDVALWHRDQALAGTLLEPHAELAGFIEGPGAWAGPSAVIVRTEDEARAWVARYDSLGYKQIKLYNLVHPDLVPTIAAEAHKRGMRLSGHIPRGLSVPAAVDLGYDEIQHAAFLFSTFYPDSLFVPKMRAYSLVAQTVAPNVDVDGAPMTQLIETLKTHHTVIDGTWAIWMRSSEEGAAVSGAKTTDTSVAARSDRNYVRLLKRLYDAGVTLVPGTDTPDGSSYDAELELYERAGIPAPEVLRIATIVPARVMRDDKDYGSIAVGKIADLIVVNGKPAEHVADLEKIEKVVRAGRVYDPAKLTKAVKGE